MGTVVEALSLLYANSAGDSVSCSVNTGLDARSWRASRPAFNASSCAAERFLPITGRTA